MEIPEYRIRVGLSVHFPGIRPRDSKIRAPSLTGPIRVSPDWELDDRHGIRLAGNDLCSFSIF